MIEKDFRRVVHVPVNNLCDFDGNILEFYRYVKSTRM